MDSPIVAVRMPKATLEMLDRRAKFERRNRSQMLVILVESALEAPSPTGAALHRKACGDCGEPVSTADHVRR